MCLLFSAFEINAKENVQVTMIADGFNHPWSLAFLPNDDILVTERIGKLKLIEKETDKIITVSGLPTIKQVGQGGLLDIALHPDFKNNQYLYLSYSALNQHNVNSTHVARAQWDNQSHPMLTNWTVIFQANSHHSGGRHFGSRLAFDSQNHLYITIGDRGHRPSSQDKLDHSGNIIRLHDDGTIPKDNPFINDASAKPGVYSYGHRNPQGLVIHNGEIWSHEHGPQGGDELNLIHAGDNYGWPVITYGKNYVIGTSIGEGTHKDGMQQPHYQWTPSIAPSGLAIYQGEQFPEWQNNFFVGSLKFSTLVRLERNGNTFIEKERMLGHLNQRIRDVRVGPDDLIYVLTDSSNGKLLQIAPKPNY